MAGSRLPVSPTGKLLIRGNQPRVAWQIARNGQNFDACSSCAECYSVLTVSYQKPTGFHPTLYMLPSMLPSDAYDVTYPGGVTIAIYHVCDGVEIFGPGSPVAAPTAGWVISVNDATTFTAYQIAKVTDHLRCKWKATQFSDFPAGAAAWLALFNANGGVGVLVTTGSNPNHPEFDTSFAIETVILQQPTPNSGPEFIAGDPFTLQVGFSNPFGVPFNPLLNNNPVAVFQTNNPTKLDTLTGTTQYFIDQTATPTLTFNNLILKKAGAGVVLDVGALNGAFFRYQAYTVPFKVKHTTPYALQMALIPGFKYVNEPFKAVVWLVDIYGNLCETINGSLVQLACSRLHGTLTQSMVNGIATFDGLTMDTAGFISNPANKVTVSSVSGGVFNTSFNMDVRLKLKWVQAPPAAVGVGTDFAPPIQVGVVDFNGNPYTGAPDQIDLFENTAHLAGTLGPLTPGVGAVATFDPVRLTAAGTFTVYAETSFANYQAQTLGSPVVAS